MEPFGNNINAEVGLDNGGDLAASQPAPSRAKSSGKLTAGAITVLLSCDETYQSKVQGITVKTTREKLWKECFQQFIIPVSRGGFGMKITQVKQKVNYEKRKLMDNHQLPSHSNGQEQQRQPLVDITNIQQQEESETTEETSSAALKDLPVPDSNREIILEALREAAHHEGGLKIWSHILQKLTWLLTEEEEAVDERKEVISYLHYHMLIHLDWLYHGCRDRRLMGKSQQSAKRLSNVFILGCSDLQHTMASRASIHVRFAERISSMYHHQNREVQMLFAHLFQCIYDIWERVRCQHHLQSITSISFKPLPPKVLHHLTSLMPKVVLHS